MAAIKALDFAQQGREGIVLCCREFMNSLDESSLEEIKRAIASEPWLAAAFDVGEKFVRTKAHYPGRVDFKFAGLRHNIDSIKSKSRILISWIDEAEPVSDTAWLKLIPTVREHESEIWVTWNPERKTSATHKRFRLNPPEGSKIVEMNYSDNPWFPDELDLERRNDQKNRPEQYDHIWEGDFVTVVEGAYFAAQMAAAKREGRISAVAADPLMETRAYWDIGGTGAKADATAIWMVQFHGEQVRVVDHYEAQGQPLSAHITWLRSQGHDKCFCWLPHDGDNGEKVYDATYRSALEAAGFRVDVVPNQGKGAAKMRIESVRRLFPQIWFNEKTTEAGRDALGWYHEKIDEEREVGLGPNHDWSSHSADAFGLMAIVHENHSTARPKKINYRSRKFA